MLLHLTNCCLFSCENDDEKELTSMLIDLTKICYPVRNARTTARGFKQYIKSIRHRSNVLLSRRNYPLQLNTITSWKKAYKAEW